MRRVTAAVGAASLATAGVVAYNLPAPAHTAANGTTTTPATTQPSASSGQSGDDGRQSGDDGGSGAATVPSGTSAQGSAHATSGGS
jgi:hypothetical protein